MFSPDIVESDAFLEMPISSQALYFHLGMFADDDGFVNPRKIMRMIGVGEDDIKVLIAKRFVLTFENGVIVIKHWKINNLVRKDWYRPTQYAEQLGMLEVKDSGAYTERNADVPMLVNESLTTRQRRLGKVRLGKDREEPPHLSKSYLLSLPEEDITAFREKYEASTSQIKRKGEQMHNYCEAKGKTYRNYKAFLENGLDKDFGRRMKIGVTVIGPAPKLSPEQKAVIAQKTKEIGAMFRAPAPEVP